MILFNQLPNTLERSFFSVNSTCISKVKTSGFVAKLLLVVKYLEGKPLRRRQQKIDKNIRAMGWSIDGLLKERYTVSNVSLELFHMSKSLVKSIWFFFFFYPPCYCALWWLPILVVFCKPVFVIKLTAIYDLQTYYLCFL